MKFKRFCIILPWLLIDTVSISLSGLLTLLVYDNIAVQIPFQEVLFPFFLFVPYNLLATVIIFYFCNLYAGIWRYLGLFDGLKIIGAVFLSVAVYWFGSSILMPEMALPTVCYFIYFVFLCLAVILSRAMLRIVQIFQRRWGDKENQKKVIIVGAGQGGCMVATEMSLTTQFRSKRPVCFIDDDPMKHKRYIQGIKVVGGRNMIVPMAKKYNVSEIIFAIPSCSQNDRTEILALCMETGCTIRMLPSTQELDQTQPLITKVRDVQIEDLLGRDPVCTDLHDIMQQVTGKRVLVTGAGGSIGSELCRQLASYSPGQLVLFDVYENSTYEIQQELTAAYPELSLVVRIGSICDEARVENLFNEFKPEIVYHAAAHKHVPLMEACPQECVKNNVFGTLHLVQAADRHETKRFVMISTDKAVNPTNVMGVTKRICEMMMQIYNARSKTEYVAVRFGNVLGSNGSVIPLFKKQIQKGGPVTLTDKNIIRYFMTIPEAVSLVLQAGVLAKGGEIFVLDMGKPVRILDLAEKLIQLSGYVPYKDIDIVVTGLRPGEKLYEELLMDEEGLRSTENKLIYIGHPLEMNAEEFFDQLEQLRQAITDGSQIKPLLQKIVTTYHPQGAEAPKTTK